MPNRQTGVTGEDQLDDGPLQLEQEREDLQLQQQQDQEHVEQQPQQAPQKQPEQGTGYQAVLKLLQGKGKPEPKDVAQVIWQHPEEKSAIVTLLQQTPAFGNSYVQQVVEASRGWNMDIKAQVLAWGDADAQGEDYFYASGKRQGAGWKLGDFSGAADKQGLQWQKGERWTGQVGRDGLHTEVKTGDDERVVVDGNYKDKQATLNADYMSGDNTLGVGLHGKDAEHLGADLHGTYRTEGGATLKGKVGLEREGEELTTGVDLAYDGRRTDVGLTGHVVDGQQHDATLTGTHALDDKRKITGELSQQTKEGETTYGARAGYTGTKNSAALEGTVTSGEQHSAKVSGSHALDDKRKITGELSQQTKEGETTYGARAGYTGTKNSAALEGTVTSGEQHSAKVSGSHALDDKRKITGELSQQTVDGKTTYGARAGVQGERGSLDLEGRYLDGEEHSVGVKGKYQIAKDLGLSVDAAHKVAAGKSTEELGLGLQSEDNQLDFKGAFTDKENYSLSLKDTHTFGDRGSLTGEGAFGSKEGEEFGRLGLSGKLDTDDHVFEGNADLLKQGEKLDLSAGFDGTFTLMDEQLYAHAFGKLDNILDDPKYQVGGGLTWTPKDKMAVTLAGLVDQDGGFDTRLQFDVFKKKVDCARDLSDQKKKALFSVFVGYKQENDGGLMNDHFGAGKLGAEQGMAYAGIKIPF